ncbi:MAG: DUF4115 domain-containing protein [Nitrosomonas sp.]|nr:DUF4115 domain-containing protein [Nitrosomonas sp.]
MMNKFEDSNQKDANDTFTTDSVPVDIDKAALINHRHAEEGSIENTDGASVVHGMGHQLQTGRISCNLSIEDVARQLRLSAKQVEALEKEDFEKLPSGTFLRGFIRNYANLVKLDPVPMLRALPSPAPTITAHTTLNLVRPQRVAPFTSNWGRERQSYGNGRNQNGLFKVIALALFLLVIYGLYQSINWSQLPFVGSGSEKEAGAVKTRATNGQSTIELQLPVSPAITSGAQNIDNQSMQTIETGVNQKQKHFSSVESLSAAIPHSKPAGGQLGAIHLVFASDSWVEVKDQVGTIVFKQESKAGTEQVVSGKRPLSLVISNAAQVDLTYNARAIDLLPYTNENDGIARLMLE